MEEKLKHRLPYRQRRALAGYKKEDIVQNLALEEKHIEDWLSQLETSFFPSTLTSWIESKITDPLIQGNCLSTCSVMELAINSYLLSPILSLNSMDCTTSVQS